MYVYMYVCTCMCACLYVCVLVRKLCRSFTWVGCHRETFVQDVKLLPGNTTIRPILHNLFHLLGRYHEHVRHDRDYFVRIHPENIVKGEKTA